MNKAQIPLLLQRKKSKDGNNSYVCLTADLGYTSKVISFDSAYIAELLGVSVVQLQEVVCDVGTFVPVGSLAYSSGVTKFIKGGD